MTREQRRPGILPEPLTGWTVELRLELEARRRVLLPDWTGKLLKTLALSDPCLAPAGRTLSAPGSFKPARVTPLLVEDRRAPAGLRPLARAPGDPRLHAEKGDVFVALASYHTRNPLEALSAGACGGRLPGPWDGLEYGVVEVQVHRAGEPIIEVTPKTRVRVDLVTPVLLPVKTPIPPVLWGRRLARRVPGMHRLLPTPGYLLAAAARVYLAAIAGQQAGDHPAVWLSYLHGETGLVEENYRLQPQTVQYAPGPRRPRLVRGATGWLIVRATRARAARLLEALAPTMHLLGVGRSRSIGFGLVRVRTV